MKISKKVEKHHIYGIVFILFILSFIIARIVYVNWREKVYREGNKSVCYMYKFKISGGRGGDSNHTGYYYFYLNENKFHSKDIILNNNKLDPTNKFYNVYFMPDNPEKNSVVDFNTEVNPDSVYKYFPKGKNPFEEEIKQLKK